MAYCFHLIVSSLGTRSGLSVYFFASSHSLDLFSSLFGLSRFCHSFPPPVFTTSYTKLAMMKLTALACLLIVNPALANPPHQLFKRASCGPVDGSCPPGQCCNAVGICGTTSIDCAATTCQIPYSDGCDYVKAPSGDSTESIPRPKVGRIPYGKSIYKCIKAKTVALTFDNGSSPYTSQLLDILDKHNVKATFFINGANDNKGSIDDPSLPWAALLRRMYAAGHQIASHTWTHQKLNKVNSTILRNEMIYNEMAIRNIFGFIPTYFRAPYFGCNRKSGCLDYVNQLGYRLIDSNLKPERGSRETFDQGLTQGYRGYIVLAHDYKAETVLNLAEYMIITAKQQGFTLTTVGECLNDPQQNWYRQVALPVIPKKAATTSSTRVKSSM